MINNLNKKWRIVAVVILTTAVLNSVFIPVANAEECGVIVGTIGACLKDALVFFFNTITDGIAYVSAAFVWLAAWLVNFSFNMNLRLSANGIITTGWNITSALANLGFVLFIIVIAFATVVRWPGYGLKEILRKLIAAALLVNFSLLIAFIFIDFSNILTSYFLSVSTAKGTSINVASSLAKAFQVQSIRESPTSTPTSLGEQFTTGLTSIIFQVIFNIIIIITLTALAAMLGIRYIALTILLILAPLAWLFWILPFTQKWWNQWWDAFIKWVVFAPAVSLFVYIAIQIVNTMGSTVSGAANAAGQGMNIDNTFIANIFQKTANMVVVVGILLGGLITAQKMGIAGASVAMGAMQKIKGAALGYAGGKIKAGYEAAQVKALTAGQKEETDLAGKPITTSFAQRFARGAARIPGFRGAAQRISTASAGLKQEVDAKYKKQFENLSDDAAINQTKSYLKQNEIVPGSVSATTFAASAKAIAEKGLSSSFTNEELQKLLKASQKTGTVKDLLAVLPNLAPMAGLSYDKALSYQRPGQADKMDHRVIEFDPKNEDKTKFNTAKEILLNQNYSNGHLARVAQEGSADLKNAINKVLANSITEFTKITGKSFDQITQADLIAKKIDAKGQNQFKQLQRMRKASRENVNLQDFVPQAEKEKAEKEKGGDEEKPKRQAGFTSPDLK
ncbi:MAG: hypothetical protein HYW34_03540 [Candidatus Brennerbacteria bacterium]|nr:hypothetical protein [Candidatus Brennerbacteria bacterium]